jgi:Uma2 family endonuclease
MDEKRALYREAGAQEIWLVELDGRIRFFGDDEQEQSQLAPDMPNRL